MLLRHYLEILDYSDLGVHAVLLADHVRVDAYRRAINEIVRPGMRVVDLGAGTGVLGRLAAQAGASVVMVEREKNVCQYAGLLNELLTPEADIEVMCADIEDVTVSHCDVVIHELIGGRLFDEGMAEALLAFSSRNQWYDSSVVIPASATLWARFVNLPPQVLNHSLPPSLDVGPRSSLQTSLVWATSPEDFNSASEWYSVGEFNAHNVPSWPQSFLLERVEIEAVANAVLWGVTVCLSTGSQLDLRLGSEVATSWGGSIEELPRRHPVEPGSYRVEGKWSGYGQREPQWIHLIQQHMVRPQGLTIHSCTSSGG